MRKFGGIDQVKEECRDAWGIRFIDTFVQDIRFGLRMLAKNPGFTAVAVITLALGIGANTAVFTILDAWVLRRLPVAHPERLVMLTTKSPQESELEVSYADYQDIRQQVKGLSGVTVYERESRYLNSFDESAQVLVDLIGAPTISQFWAYGL